MIHGWWHRFVRRRTKPIAPDQALLWKRRLSIAYGLLAWHAFGALVYAIYTGKADWAHYHGLKTDEEKAMPPARQFASSLGISNAKVYRMSGFTKVDEYEIADGKEKRQPREAEEVETIE